jgi:5,10-methylenetetrahydrofolate reductase
MSRTKNGLVARAAFAVVVALSVIGSACEADTQAKLDVDSLEKRIQSDGAQRVVSQIYGRPDDWNKLRHNIASGNVRWLALATALYSGADGGAKNMLAASFGESLETAASSTLRVAAREKMSTDVFCIAPDVDDDRYSTYESAMQSLQNRISAVTSVAGPELATARTACLHSLTDSQTQIAKFFGR